MFVLISMFFAKLFLIEQMIIIFAIILMQYLMTELCGLMKMTGMMHTMDHDKINAKLAKLLDSEGLDIQLSFDGMQIPINL